MKLRECLSPAPLPGGRSLAAPARPVAADGQAQGPGGSGRVLGAALAQSLVPVLVALGLEK